METRRCNLIVQSPGGTAGSGASTYKIALPTAWVKELGLGREDRQVELTFDGSRICIAKRLDVDGFVQKKKAMGHPLLLLSYYDGEQLCSRIAADYQDKTLCVENFAEDVVKTAFGNQSVPDWEGYEEFLESRCVPRARAGLRQYLDALGLDAYVPLEIIRKTAGKMAEDQQWLEIEEIV